MGHKKFFARAPSLLALSLFSACDEDPKQQGEPRERLSLAELKNPETCAGCHPRHYREWKSSMHAYASLDPVFRAMNQRGQRETNHAMGDFCVNCHAPMAVREGLTTDGLNIADVPKEFQGVTCYFCHNTVGIEANHNGKLTLANDQTMRGSLREPDAVDPGVHAVEYSILHDRDSLKGSEFCGSCHDVVNSNGVHLERTLAEYMDSGMSKQGTDAFDTCTGCHMDVSGSGEPVAVMPGVQLPERELHEHLWPGVDVALTDDFPDQAAMRKAVECDLQDGTRAVSLKPTNELFTSFQMVYETLAGHAQPSGASQDRRMWLEFRAYDEDDNLIFQTGSIADGAVEQVPEGQPGHDPLLKMYRDHIFDAAGKEVHMFWEAAPSAAFPTGFSHKVLPLPVMLPGTHYETIDIAIPRSALGGKRPARVVTQLRMRPVGMDILNDLVATGDLDPTVPPRMPTFTLLSTVMEWRIEDGPNPITKVERALKCPNEYLELLK